MGSIVGMTSCGSLTLEAGGAFFCVVGSIEAGGGTFFCVVGSIEVVGHLVKDWPT